MAAAVGSFIKNNLFHVTSSIGYLQLTSIGLLKYMTHGIPEIAAYFIGALASGIISFALVKHDYKSKHFKRIIGDGIDLILISILILFIAGLIEIFVTPIIV